MCHAWSPRDYTLDLGSPTYAIEVLAEMGRYTLWQSPDTGLLGLDDDQGHEPRGFYLAHTCREECMPLHCGHEAYKGETIILWVGGDWTCLDCAEQRMLEEDE